jgi:hypothetical protein
MYKFGKKSLDKIATLDPRLQEVLHEAIKLVDFTVLEGHRDQATQDKYFAEGKSKLKWPNSKHNKAPSLAVDVAPWPISWENREQFAYVAGIIMGIGLAKGIKMRWGGDFNRNGRIDDEKFIDMPHIEIDE